MNHVIGYAKSVTKSIKKISVPSPNTYKVKNVNNIIHIAVIDLEKC